MTTAPAAPALPSRLRRSALGTLPGEVSVPTYDVNRLRAGVVHIGLGRFHRAHQARYFDELAERRISTDWAIVGAGMRGTTTRDLLAAQDNLFTVIGADDRGPTARVVGALQHCYHAPSERAGLLRRLADPALPLVTLTVTAEAYDCDAGGGMPAPVFTLLAEALARRWRAGDVPFTVLSCDNVADNGRAARRAVLSAARGLEPSGRLARWIDDHGAFPRSMVDRITPVMDDHLHAAVTSRLGLADPCAVVAERHSDWVVEDVFSSQRPPLDEVGVQFVTDVEPYATAKTRLLNGGHCAVGYLGSVAGHRTSADAMADPVISSFVTALLRREVAPTLAGTGGPAVGPYTDLVLGRIADPTLADPLTRLSRRGSVRLPTYVVPSLRDALAAGRSARRLTLVVAAWAVHLRRTGASTEDGLADVLVPAARDAHLDGRPLLRACPGMAELAGNRAFVAELEAQVRDLELLGVAGAIQQADARKAGLSSTTRGRRARAVRLPVAGVAGVTAASGGPLTGGDLDAAAS